MVVIYSKARAYQISDLCQGIGQAQLQAGLLPELCNVLRMLHYPGLSH